MDQWLKHLEPLPPEFSGGKKVHIWKISLNLSIPVQQKLKNILNKPELERAAAFHFEKDRSHFIAARGQMRFLLGKYLQMDPASIEFNYNNYGKPYFPGSELFFNISHSHQLGLLAISSHYPLGIDIEWKRPDFGGMAIAKRFFSEREVNALQSFAPNQQNEAFFACWSRKEAYIKGQGMGLSIPLKQFDVSMDPSQPAQLLATPHQPDAVHHWSLQALNADDTYASAIAVKALKWEFSLFDGCDLEQRICT